MKILFAGTPSIAVTVLGGLINSGHEIVGVLTREDAPTGRKQVLTPSAVAEFAATRKLPVIKANRLTKDIHNEIIDLKADLAIVVAFGTILKEDSLAILPEGWFNLHFSLLPKYRGAAPVQHALLNGEHETGVTLFKLDRGMDTGPVLAQVPTRIEPDETSGYLLQRLAHLGVSLLNEQLPRIYSGVHELLPQPSEGSLAPKITRADAELKFDSAAITVLDQIRAMNPEPMSWASIAGQPLRILLASPHSIKLDAKPGEISDYQGRPLVVCAGGEVIELLQVQPAGKKLMSGEDWLRGHQNVRKFD